MDNLWNIILTILVIILFILVIVLFIQGATHNKSTDDDGTSDFNIFNPTTFFSEIKKDKDILVHSSGENQRKFSLINNLLHNFGHIDFISLNNVSDDFLKDSLDSNKMPNFASYNENSNTYILNNNNQFLQGFIETVHVLNYNAVSLKIGFPLGVLNILQNNKSYVYLRKYQRYFDKKNFFYIQFNINPSLKDDEKYTVISSFIEYIKSNFPGDYMFVGNFAVQGHEFVFSNYFSDKNYLICPFYKTLTGNDENGLTAYDGLVVSRNLYNSINYKIDFVPGDSTKRYMIIVELIYAGFGTIKDSSSILFKKYIETLVKNIGNRKNYINDKGTYSKNNISSDISKIEKINI